MNSIAKSKTARFQAGRILRVAVALGFSSHVMLLAEMEKQPLSIRAITATSNREAIAHSSQEPQPLKSGIGASNECSLPINSASLSDSAIGAGYTRDKSAVPQLTAWLSDPSPKLVRNCAWALGEIGDRTVLPQLKGLLTQPDLGTKCYAAEAICKLGDLQTGVPALIEVIEAERSKLTLNADGGYTGTFTITLSPHALANGAWSAHHELEFFSPWARAALVRIAKQDFGHSHEAWFVWWENNKAQLTIPHERMTPSGDPN